MYGANYFGQPYFGQGPAADGPYDQYLLRDIINATTRFLNGVRNSRGLEIFRRSTRRIAQSEVYSPVIGSMTDGSWVQSGTSQ